MAVLLAILFVLCVLLLLPVRVKASYCKGEWALNVYYACVCLLHRGSKPKPPAVGVPEPCYEQPGDKPETNSEPKPKPEPKTEKPEPKIQKPEPKPGKPEPKPEPEPTAEKPEKTEEPENNDKSEEPEKPQKPKKPKKKSYLKRLIPHGLHEYWETAKDALSALSPAMRFLTRHLHFRHVKIRAVIAADDPAKTAMLYGSICSAAYPLLGQLQCWFDFQADEIRILSDFCGGKSDFEGSLELRVSPLAALAFIVVLGVKFLWRAFARFRREDKDAARYAEETAPLTGGNTI